MNTRIWCDLETTGLDAGRDLILEVAMSVEESGGLKEIFHAVCGAPDWVLEEMDPYVRTMHSKSGLLDEVRQQYRSSGLSDLKDALLLALKPFISDGKLTIAGSCVDFDLGFLKVDYPDVAHLFSHRKFDVSAIKLFCQDMGMSVIPKKEIHRARADILESYDHYLQCKAWIRHGIAHTQA